TIQFPEKRMETRTAGRRLFEAGELVQSHILASLRISELWRLRVVSRLLRQHIHTACILRFKRALATTRLPRELRDCFYLIFRAFGLRYALELIPRDIDLVTMLDIIGTAPRLSPAQAGNVFARAGFGDNPRAVAFLRRVFSFPADIEAFNGGIIQEEGCLPVERSSDVPMPQLSSYPPRLTLADMHVIHQCLVRFDVAGAISYLTETLQILNMEILCTAIRGCGVPPLSLVPALTIGITPAQPPDVVHVHSIVSLFVMRRMWEDKQISIREFVWGLDWSCTQETVLTLAVIRGLDIDLVDLWRQCDGRRFFSGVVAVKSAVPRKHLGGAVEELFQQKIPTVLSLHNRLGCLLRFLSESGLSARLAWRILGAAAKDHWQKRRGDVVALFTALLTSASEDVKPLPGISTEFVRLTIPDATAIFLSVVYDLDATRSLNGNVTLAEDLIRVPLKKEEFNRVLAALNLNNQRAMELLRSTEAAAGRRVLAIQDQCLAPGQGGSRDS
ncbi:hypothetical protein HDU93_009536, partial [Gonapodya sp. JEL0774]